MTRHDLISVLRVPKRPPADSYPDLLTHVLGEGGKKGESGRPGSRALSARPQIFNDAPAEVDAFGFTPFVRALSDIVLSEATETPLTICIDGEWGTGKTSIMRLIDRQAKLVGLPSVWLNAWSLEDTSNLISSVSADIQREAERWQELEYKWYSPWKRIIKSLARAFLSMSGSGGRLIAELDVLTGASSKRAMELASVVTAQHSFEELVEILLRAVEEAPAPNDPEGRGPATKPRLIVFIDDIDRALPDQIVTTLKTLRLVLDNRHCVFILGMDLELVARSIVNYYSGRPSQAVTPEEISVRAELSSFGRPDGLATTAQVDFGRCYLEKLIQLHVKVPGLNRAKVEEYLQGLALAQEVIEIVRWSPDQEALNPRRLKRYVNWLSITLQLIKDSELPADVSNLTALRILAFRRGYPEIYRKVARDDGFSSFMYSDLAESTRERRYMSDEKEVNALELFLESFIKYVPLFERFLAHSSLLKSTVGDIQTRSFAEDEDKDSDYPTA